MKKTAAMPALFMMLVLTGCYLDFSGLFGTMTGVDERFTDSTNLAAPPDTLFAGTNYFSFVHVTDLHVTGGTNIHLGSLPGRITPQDKFILVSGDLVDTGRESEYQLLLSMLSNLGLPFYCSVGNHDLWHGGWDFYPVYLGPAVYSVQAGPVRLISLDAANATLGWKQRQWLEEQLIQRTEPFCIVMMHFNLLSPQIMETGQFADIEEVYALMAIFEEYAVDYVLMGHTHQYDYQLLNGVNYLVGEELKQNSDDHKEYNRLTVSNSSISHQILPLD